MESRCLHVEDIGEIPMWRVKGDAGEQGKKEDDSR